MVEKLTDKDAGGDEFEAKNMQDGARIVCRDKKVARGMAALLAFGGLFTMSIGVMVAVTNATSSKPVPATALPFVVAAVVALGLLLITLGIVLAVVRTLVTDRYVDVKMGLWGPRIPLENIRSCSVIEYDWKKFGGWGIRISTDGTRAYVPASGRVIELCYVEDGKEKRVVVGADDADRTAREINLAHERLEYRGPQLRVEDTSKGDVETEAIEGDEARESAKKQA